MSATGFQIAVGFGCDRGTPLATLQQALDEALALAGASVADVVAAASIDLKTEEVGLLALAVLHGWRLTFYSPEQLAAVQVLNPSETVRKYTGTPSVSEAAALLAGRAGITDLLVEKYRFKGPDGKNATVSIVRLVCADSFLM